MNTPDSILERMIADFDEAEHLKHVSNQELVREYLEFESDIAVEEMLTRLWPEWAAKEIEH